MSLADDSPVGRFLAKRGPGMHHVAFEVALDVPHVQADQHEDREHGDARGDELPAALASKAGRLARLRQAKALLEAEAAERQRRR